MEEKLCKYCNENKNKTYFPMNNRNKDKIDNRCKDCFKIKYQENKVQKLESQKKWRNVNKDYQQKWRKDNPERINYEKGYYQNNKEQYMLNKQKWRKTNPYQAYIEGKKYREENRDKVNKYAREWKHNKRKTDINYKLKENMSRRIRYEITKDNISTEDFLNCKIEKLKMYIESKFDIGMNWNNYGMSWEIDHTIPCASWDFTNVLDSTMCWNFKNLKPMWKLQNRIKKDNYNSIDKNNYIFLFKAVNFGL
jgi:hypothetical protein